MAGSKLYPLHSPVYAAYRAPFRAHAHHCACGDRPQTTPNCSFASHPVLGSHGHRWLASCPARHGHRRASRSRHPRDPISRPLPTPFPRPGAQGASRPPRSRTTLLAYDISSHIGSVAHTCDTVAWIVPCSGLWCSRLPVPGPTAGVCHISFQHAAHRSLPRRECLHTYQALLPSRRLTPLPARRLHCQGSHCTAKTFVPRTSVSRVPGPGWVMFIPPRIKTSILVPISVTLVSHLYKGTAVPFWAGQERQPLPLAPTADTKDGRSSYILVTICPCLYMLRASPSAPVPSRACASSSASLLVVIITRRRIFFFICSPPSSS